MKFRETNPMDFRVRVVDRACEGTKRAEIIFKNLDDFAGYLSDMIFDNSAPILAMNENGPQAEPYGTASFTSIVSG